MKIVCWNLLNIASSKLPKAFTGAFTPFGMGGTVLQYMVNLVMNMSNGANGNPIWDWSGFGISALPADIFVIIELRTGGKMKGSAISGPCQNTLTTIRDAMNVAATTRGLQATYQYDFATSLITGNREAVGVIFNNKVFKPNPDTESIQDNNNRYINPRTPFLASLIDANDKYFNIFGIHAPPVKGGVNVRYRPPIDFVKKMDIVDKINPGSAMFDENYFVMGDFNCNPGSSYVNGMNQNVFGFTQLITWGYNSLIPNGTLSSLRINVNNNFQPPANYLSDAYDNLIYKFDTAPGGISERILDLIQYSRNVTNTPPTWAYVNPPVALLNNNRKVSDHLPMVIEFN